MKRFLSLGLVLVLALALALPCYATSDTYSYNDVVLPDFPDFDVYSADYPYAIIISAADGYLFYLLPHDNVVLYSAGLRFNSSATVRVYELSADGASWVYINSQSYTSSQYLAKSSYGSSWVWSNFDIYSDSGSLCYEGDLNFHRPPLAEVVQAVTAEGLTEMLPKVAGTMKILALCGVGCLALLVGLRLFGKRSLIYRS